MDHVKTLSKICAIGVGLVLASTAAEAKGCIKGAILGGLGGHYIGHQVRGGHLPTVIGAATGCLVGRHEAHRRVRAAARPAQPSASRPAQTPATRSVQRPPLGSAQALHSRSIQSGR
jgi:hypothetical protein